VTKLDQPHNEQHDQQRIKRMQYIIRQVMPYRVETPESIILWHGYPGERCQLDEWTPKKAHLRKRISSIEWLNYQKRRPRHPSRRNHFQGQADIQKGDQRD